MHRRTRFALLQEACTAMRCDFHLAAPGFAFVVLHLAFAIHRTRCRGTATTTVVQLPLDLRTLMRADMGRRRHLHNTYAQRLVRQLMIMHQWTSATPETFDVLRGSSSITVAVALAPLPQSGLRAAPLHRCHLAWESCLLWGPGPRCD